MKYHYDLHIHSVLSPCADDLMTPNNIFNMAKLKNLNIISITDHNSLRQLPVISQIAQSYDMLWIPGIEITTKENVHVLCYFRNLEKAMQFETVIKEYRKTNNSSIQARLSDIEDYVIGTLEDVSSDPIDITYPQLCLLLKDYDHLRFLAHLDRPKMKGLNYLDDTFINGIELIKDDFNFIHLNNLSKFKILFNSDAHDLMSISEPSALNILELEKLDIDTFFMCFRHG
jgi:PHP family Zn ribbon phosphoesterase